MTELYVNDKEVILPDAFSFTLIEENPEITNKGEFSLDMTVSLMTAKNAIAFGFLNRLNLATIMKTAPAKLIVNGSTRLGSIIIIDNTDVEVTFQFVAGNSELNYNAKVDNRKIWELDWGSETAIDYARALDSITNPSYTKKFVCTPVLSGTTVLNDYYLTDDLAHCAIKGVNNIVMQPYILFYINKLPELLGFSLKSNILNLDSRAQKMYIVNSVSSLKYADALPDMTVSQFINEIEFFFNVSFYVDKKNNELSIISLKSNLLLKKRVSIKNVLDSYERDLSQEKKLNKFGFTKIKYDIPDSLFFKYQNFSEDILSKCETISFNTYGDLYTYIFEHNNENQFKIFKTGDYEYIFGKDLTLNVFTRQIGNVEDNKHINLVNKLKSYGESSENELVLKICPAEMIVKTIAANLIEGQGGDIYTNPQYQLPKSTNSDFNDFEQGLTNAIESGIKKIPRTSNIEVSLFTGKIVMENYPYKYSLFEEIRVGKELYYPFSHIDKYPEYGPVGHTTSPPYSNWVPPDYGEFEKWMFAYFTPAANTNMRIAGSSGIFFDYHFQQILDTSKEYIFILPDSRDITAKNIFSINNTDYMPIYFEREINDDQKTVKGTFYQLK